MRHPKVSLCFLQDQLPHCTPSETLPMNQRTEISLIRSVVLYPETQATGLTPNCKSDLYQFYKTALGHAIHTGLIQMCAY